VLVPLLIAVLILAFGAFVVKIILALKGMP
jgi:hypothetical protein